MYRLCDVWNNTFEEIKKSNGGILAVYATHENTKVTNFEKVKILADVNETNHDKLSMLLNDSIISDSEKNNGYIASELINGSVSVRRGGCASYISILGSMQRSIERDSLQKERNHLLLMVQNSIRARKYIDEKNRIYEEIELSKLELIDCQKELSAIELMLCNLLKTNFRDLLKCKKRAYVECNESEDIDSNNVWDFFAWVIYNALLKIDFSDAKRDRTAILENIERLENTINTNKSKKKSKSVEDDTPKIMNFQQLCELGYTPLEIGRALVDNDNALYHLGDDERELFNNKKEPHKNEGSPELWSEFLSSFPETFEYLVYNNQIVGNYSLVALSEEQIEALLRGELYEADFAIEKNEPFVFPGNYVLYLLNFSVNIGWNTVDNYNKLWQALLDKIEKYAQQGIFFEKIYVNTFRNDHRALYKRLGFRFIIDNKIEGQVYELKKFPEDLKWPNKETLIKLYQNRW